MYKYVMQHTAVQGILKEIQTAQQVRIQHQALHCMGKAIVAGKSVPSVLIFSFHRILFRY
jgi:hypothetical protein